MFLYAAYRLLTAPILTRPIVVDLPQRIGTAPPKPARPAYSPPAPAIEPVTERPPAVEQGMSDDELEEWKRRNAESMRILEEAERADAAQKQ